MPLNRAYLPSGPAAPDGIAGKAVSVGGIELLWIPPGTFMMGAGVDGPPTEVTISRGFWLGRVPVTQGQWEKAMGANPSRFRNAGSDAPVESVSWDEAKEFCRRIQAGPGAAGCPSGFEFRAPTEAEWEYACRAGESGDAIPQLAERAWYEANSGGTTHPVGRKRPNAWGFFDMQGNVGEWCFDRRYDVYRGWAVTDPAGWILPDNDPDSGDATSLMDRMVRGGCWCSPAAACAGTYRDWSNPLDSYYGLIGFRLALAPGTGPLG